MIRLGKAQLVTYKHSTGAEAQGLALNPWVAGYILHLGLKGAVLPPPGSTVDRTFDNQTLRIDTGTGEVWRLETGDGPPALGPTGGPMQQQKRKIPLLLVLAIAAFLAFKFKR